MSPEECRQVFEMLSEYIDDELPPDTCQQIEQHIAGCAPCIEFVESLKKSVKVFRNYKPGEEPPPLDERSKEQLAQAFRAMTAKRA
jgi:anti-sigma factor RsiW